MSLVRNSPFTVPCSKPGLCSSQAHHVRSLSVFTLHCSDKMDSDGSEDFVFDSCGKLQLDEFSPEEAAEHLQQHLQQLKRRKIRMHLRCDYSFLAQDVVEGLLPDPNQYKSKRSWETAMSLARKALRELAAKSCMGPQSSDSVIGETSITA